MAKLNFGLMGYRFKTDDTWLNYQTAYGKSARVLKSDIQSVSLAEGKRGRATIQINGSGTTLASIELPQKWAQKAQEFILRDIGKI